MTGNSKRASGALIEIEHIPQRRTLTGVDISHKYKKKKQTTGIMKRGDGNKRKTNEHRQGSVDLDRRWPRTQRRTTRNTNKKH